MSLITKKKMNEYDNTEEKGGKYMYYQSYEDYMRSVLGYPIENRNTYQTNYLENTQNCITPYQNTKELEEYYPEIYKIINPIVCEVCDKCNVPITRDIIENMIDEVYQKIEINNEIAIKINIENRNIEKEIENRTNVQKSNINRNNVISEPIRKVSEVENRQRRPQNPLLRDLIRILILNRLLGGNFQGRPPYQRPPVRPPFPGGPRPPQNRDYEDYFKF